MKRYNAATAGQDLTVKVAGDSANKWLYKANSASNTTKF